MNPSHFNKFPAGSAGRDYDVFEQLPDGTAMWRAFVVGMESAESKLQELSRGSANKFFAVCLKDRAAPLIYPIACKPLAKQKSNCA